MFLHSQWSLNLGNGHLYNYKQYIDISITLYWHFYADTIIFTNPTIFIHLIYFLIKIIDIDCQIQDWEFKDLNYICEQCNITIQSNNIFIICLILHIKSCLDGITERLISDSRCRVLDQFFTDNEI